MRENIEKFCSEMKATADRERRAVVTETEAFKAKLTFRAEKEAKLFAEQYFKRESEKIAVEFSKQFAEFSVGNKAAVLKKREELIKDLLLSVEKRLSDFKNSKDYLPFLIRSAEKIKENGEFVFVLDKADMKYKDALKEYAAGFEEYSGKTLGGIRAKSTDGSMFIDDSLDTREASALKEFREKSELII